MKTKLLACCLLFAGAIAHAGAMTAIFYQPQNGDRAVPDKQWPTVFARAHARGFDTLVVQWTAHGDPLGGRLSFSVDDAAGHAWLRARLLDARRAGLQTVLGLTADYQSFARLERHGDALARYFRRLHAQDRAVLDNWQHDADSATIAGWYLPLEIDDRRWRDAAPRAALLSYLRQSATMAADTQRPLYVSTFFAGNMAPEAYAGLLRDIARTGVHPWVQDGIGTGKLLPAERNLYLAPVHRCDAQVAHGLIYEIFRQTGTDAAFSAEPAGNDMRGLLVQRAPCGKDSLFFELRYLPELNGILPIK
ncbi:MAG: DUF4434 domain-containing protein [Pseudomonadota bacterium]